MLSSAQFGNCPAKPGGWQSKSTLLRTEVVSPLFLVLCIALFQKKGGYSEGTKSKTASSPPLCPLQLVAEVKPSADN